jgi:gliding motility-associated lipoprotein GldH
MKIENRPAAIIYLIALLIIPLIYNSCSNGNIYAEVQQIEGTEWSRYNDLNFSAQIGDTITPCDLQITLRNSTDYPYRNIFLFVTTTSPNGESVKDTIEYYLADERGEWLGKGLGDIHDLSVPFRSNILFPISGEYHFRIEHGMRTEDLKGIIDVGIRITKKKT